MNARCGKNTHIQIDAVYTSHYPFDQHNIRQHEVLNLDMTMKQFDRCLANRHPMSVKFDVLDKQTHTRAHKHTAHTDNETKGDQASDDKYSRYCVNLIYIVENLNYAIHLLVCNTSIKFLNQLNPIAK